MKKDIETKNKDQSEIKNTKAQLNNTLEGINSRLDDTEDHISDLEDKVEKTQRQSTKTKKNNFFKNEESLRNILDNVKHNNIHIMGIPERGESKQVIENLFEKNND